MLLRQQAATTSPVLRGRLYDVVHTWQRTLASALLDAGFTDLQAQAAAEAATALWQGSITRWLGDDDPGTLGSHLAAAFAALA